MEALYVWLEILQHVPDVRDRCSLRSSCRAFSKHLWTREDRMYRSLVIADKNKKKSDAANIQQWVGKYNNLFLFAVYCGTGFCRGCGILTDPQYLALVNKSDRYYRVRQRRLSDDLVAEHTSHFNNIYRFHIDDTCAEEVKAHNFCYLMKSLFCAREYSLFLICASRILNNPHPRWKLLRTTVERMCEQPACGFSWLLEIAIKNIAAGMAFGGIDSRICVSDLRCEYNRYARWDTDRSQSPREYGRMVFDFMRTLLERCRDVDRNTPRLAYATVFLEVAGNPAAPLKRRRCSDDRSSLVNRLSDNFERADLLVNYLETVSRIMRMLDSLTNGDPAEDRWIETSVVWQ